MTITIQLEESSVSVLQDEAASLGLSVEQLADAILRAHIRNPSNTFASEAAFQKAMADTLSKNAELYRRLAQ